VSTGASPFDTRDRDHRMPHVRATPPTVPVDQVVRLWLHLQGLAMPLSGRTLTAESFTDHLERTGGLQVDTLNVVDRAHYLTLWSRYGSYDRALVDDWVHRDRIAFEYWAHEASILPIAHLPLGRRRMLAFPPRGWLRQSWWQRYQTSAASKRRVLGRLRREGPLESAAFAADPDEWRGVERPGGNYPMAKEDGRSLKLLWHAGRVAICGRRHFRCVYDLFERVHPAVKPVSPAAYEDSWLLGALGAQGIASERHLAGYFTAHDLDAGGRRRVISRNLRRGKVVEVRVAGRREPFYALPEHLDGLGASPEPGGTTLVCPFDSLLWQRRRAEDLLDFRFRVELYTPAARREFGHYVMPILHGGRLVGRLDPKFHRERSELEIRAVRLEPGRRRDEGLARGLAAALRSLGEFVGARRIVLPRGWRGLA